VTPKAVLAPSLTLTRFAYCRIVR